MVAKWSKKRLFMSLINIIVLSFKLLVDCWDVFVYGRGWPHASQVCCDTPSLRHYEQKVQKQKELKKTWVSKGKQFEDL